MSKMLTSFFFWLNALIIIIFIGIASIRIAVDSEVMKQNNPHELYRIYIDGHYIGAIEEYDALIQYMDEQTKQLEQTYELKDLKHPRNIQIDKSLTTQTNIISLIDAKELVKKHAVYTMDGYIVTIDHVNKFYIRSKEDLNNALQSLIDIYVNLKQYENFKQKLTYDLSELGEYYQDVYIDNVIEVTNDYVPVEETLLSKDAISHYLLYSTSDKQDTYTVVQGDDIESIAQAYQLNVGELLVANPNLRSDTLLAPGEILNVGLINPMVDVWIEKYLVELQEVDYITEYTKTDTLYKGNDEVLHEGVEGSAKVTFKILEKNGARDSAIQVAYEVKTPAINRIVAVGTKLMSNVGKLNDWRWPTRSGYTITTDYEWRKGTFHYAIDITGTGYNSPIYAANNGTISDIWYDSKGGNQIIIDHNNGYITWYAHLATGSILVKEGQTVRGGQQIAGMGKTGYVLGTTGIHLHFAVKYNDVFINPHQLYR